MQALLHCLFIVPVVHEINAVGRDPALEIVYTVSYVVFQSRIKCHHRGIQTASWFDADGVRYSVPVNTRKPSYEVSAYLTYRQPVGKQKRLTLGLTANADISASTSYQATSRRAGMDLLTFDYNAFMADFWGDAGGSRFYSGQSGFAESRTRRFSFYVLLNAEYRLDRFSAEFTASVQNVRSRYSLDPTANTDYWSFTPDLELIYETLHGWEFKTDASYHIYRGYAPGYNDPYCLWNLSVSKNIKAFTLSLGISDILNQERALYRNVSAEYVEDTRSLIMGRYAMFSVKWSFGKMNPAKNARVQNAMFNML